ncbi:hypothetical protein N7G274_001967 [Stereocaulon virgatum]|uniref:C2H2-type domain-containing protein n=1 Tax=Stereocaulon virgatum TaxID=373712 RepID=A0ABR4AIE4_9LECA
MEDFTNYQSDGRLEHYQPVNTAPYSNYIDPSVTVYSSRRDEYPQQQQHFYGNWSSYSSNNMERVASRTSDSSSSSYPYQSSQGTTPPADFPDDQDDNQCKSDSRRSGNSKKNGKYLHCLYHQCEYKTERQFDLERHMNKHYPPRPGQLLDCPGRGCGRVGEHGFKRKDHLTEHLRKVHAKPIPKQCSRKTKK